MSHDPHNPRDERDPREERDPQRHRVPGDARVDPANDPRPDAELAVNSPRENVHGPPGQPHHPTVTAYLVVWLILMVLLVLTIVVAAVHIPYIGFLIAMAIAISKGLLVVLYFMHVRYSSPIVWVFSGAAFLWFGILIVLTIQDYMTRGWLMWE
jgi:cytochrome c oxidase subunit IV